MSSRPCGCVPQPASPIPQLWSDVDRLDLREASPGFCPQNAPNREVQQVQVWWIWWQIRRNPEICQQLLGGPGHVGWHWICRKAYFPSCGPRGPHAVTKVLGKCQRWPVHRQEPAFGCENLQDLLSFCLHRSFCPFAMASDPCYRLAAFSLWKPHLYYCWGPCESLYVDVPRRSLSNAFMASDLHGDWAIAHPQPLIYAIARTAAHWLLHNFPLTNPQRQWQQAVHNWPPHPVCTYTLHSTVGAAGLVHLSN